MNTLEIIETVIVAEALGLMLYVIIKLGIQDFYHKKSFITRKVEMYMKYRLFRTGLIFIFFYFLSLFLVKLLSLRIPNSKTVLIVSIIGNLALLLLIFNLLKISSQTYGKHRIK